MLAYLDKFISFFEVSHKDEGDELQNILSDLNKIKESLEKLVKKSEIVKKPARNFVEEKSVAQKISPVKPESVAEASLKNTLPVIPNEKKEIIPDPPKIKTEQKTPPLPAKRENRPVKFLSESPLSARKTIPEIPLMQVLKEELKPHVDPERVRNTYKSIVSTHYATCRIHNFLDNSYTIEIIDPSHINYLKVGDEKSADIVITLSPDGQAALFHETADETFQKIHRLLNHE